MKVAIIGSRELKVENLQDFLPKDVCEIVSGGARGVDLCAKSYALQNKIKYTEYLPEYEKYGKSAPLKRNIDIINQADFVIAFWDGVSRGTAFVIKKCKEMQKPIKIYLYKNKTK